jgi:hypothetical protein
MLAKKTSKNQITLPQVVVTRFAGVDYFDVSTDGESINLKPLKVSRADEVRAKLSQLGITQRDLDDALQAVRRKK